MAQKNLTSYILFKLFLLPIILLTAGAITLAVGGAIYLHAGKDKQFIAQAQKVNIKLITNYLPYVQKAQKDEATLLKELQARSGSNFEIVSAKPPVLSFDNAEALINCEHLGLNIKTVEKSSAKLRVEVGNPIFILP